jgi:SAM-dependent methyltransferase
MWPKVRTHLPPPPAIVVEVGCGPRGGFVPSLEAAGYQALGIDPEAPEGASFRRVELERSALPRRIDVAVASTSLHHVEDPGVVLDILLERLSPDGVMIVIEWDWEQFNEATAQWCFDRLGHPGSSEWLRHLQEEWSMSGMRWDDYLRSWIAQEGLHSAGAMLGALRSRLDEHLCGRGPYFFPELTGITEADEQRAIDAGVVRATRLDFVGVPRN